MTAPAVAARSAATRLDTVAVHSVDLHVAAADVATYRRLLSRDEQDRADRFGHADTRAQFVVTRAVLRLLLAAEVGCPPERLRIGGDGPAKPVLLDHPDLHFNVSHTTGLALVAHGACGPVGVDVESLDTRADVSALAARCLSPRERAALDALPAGARRAAFLTAWTRKEAVVKALGVGLARDLASVQVTLSPGEPARLLGPDAADWRLLDVGVGDSHRAALAVRAGPAGPRAITQTSWPGLGG